VNVDIVPPDSDIIQPFTSLTSVVSTPPYKQMLLELMSYEVRDDRPAKVPAGSALSTLPLSSRDVRFVRPDSRPEGIADSWLLARLSSLSALRPLNRFNGRLVKPVDSMVSEARLESPVKRPAGKLLSAGMPENIMDVTAGYARNVLSVSGGRLTDVQSIVVSPLLPVRQLHVRQISTVADAEPLGDELRDNVEDKLVLSLLDDVREEDGLNEPDVEKVKVCELLKDKDEETERLGRNDGAALAAAGDADTDAD
jgi:hypothetical protein